MKIAISTTNGTSTEPINPRFGRCESFAIFDTQTETWSSLTNPAIEAQGGAGTKVVQFLLENAINVIITGHYGPNAFRAIQASNIEAFQSTSGTPQELVEKYHNHQLTPATQSEKHHH
jgi:predicted Fe-Mo cluster-binding NifX family protein